MRPDIVGPFDAAQARRFCAVENPVFASTPTVSPGPGASSLDRDAFAQRKPAAAKRS